MSLPSIAGSMTDEYSTSKTQHKILSFSEKHIVSIPKYELKRWTVRAAVCRRRGHSLEKTRTLSFPYEQRMPLKSTHAMNLHRWQRPDRMTSPPVGQRPSCVTAQRGLLNMAPCAKKYERRPRRQSTQLIAWWAHGARDQPGPSGATWGNRPKGRSWARRWAPERESGAAFVSVAARSGRRVAGWQWTWGFSAIAWPGRGELDENTSSCASTSPERPTYSSGP